MLRARIGTSPFFDGVAVRQLIQARGCTDAESCERFSDAPWYYGPFSCTETFESNRWAVPQRHFQGSMA